MSSGFLFERRGRLEDPMIVGPNSEVEYYEYGYLFSIPWSSFNNEDAIEMLEAEKVEKRRLFDDFQQKKVKDLVGGAYDA